MTYKKSQLTRSLGIFILLLSLVSFGLVARTGYLGGQIRHTEIASGGTQDVKTGENNNEDSEKEDKD